MKREGGERGGERKVGCVRVIFTSQPGLDYRTDVLYLGEVQQTVESFSVIPLSLRRLRVGPLDPLVGGCGLLRVSVVVHRSVSEGGAGTGLTEDLLAVVVGDSSTTSNLIPGERGREREREGERGREREILNV